MSGAIVGAAVVAVTGSVVAGAVASVAAGLAVSFVTQALFKPPSRGNAGTGSTQTYTDNKVSIKQAAASAQIVYGLARVPAVMAYAKSTDGNRYLHVVYLLAGHECEAFHTVTINEEWFAIGLLDADGFVQHDGAGGTSQYAGKVRFKFHLGSPDQDADATLISESSGDWTSADRLRGICYMYVRLEWDQKVFIGGIPNITALVYGKNDIYDPSTGTTGYAGNAALCAANYLCDPTFGLGVDMNTGIDLAALQAAADTCYEEVALADGGSEDRYIANGVTISSNQPQEILGQLLGAMQGRVAYNGSVWRIIAGAYQAPSLDFTDDDLRAGPTVQTLTSRRDLFNTVKGTYFEPKSLFNEVDFPPIVDPDLVAAEGEIVKDIQLPFSSTAGTCQRIAKILLKRSRTGMRTAVLPCKLSAWRVQAGDTIRWTSARYGWSNQQFEVHRAQFTIDKDSGVLGVDLTVSAVDPADYDWSSDEEGAISPGSTTTLPNPLSVAAPTGLVLSEVAHATAPGAGVTSDISVTWTASIDAFVTGYQVEYKKSADATWIVRPQVTAAADVIRDLAPGTWNVRVAAVNLKGVLSSYLSGTLVTTGDLTPPADPSGLTVSYSATVGGASLANLIWTPASEEKVRSGGKVEIRYQAVSSGGSWAAATAIDTVAGDQQSATERFRTGTYFIKFISAAGIYSTNASSVVATASNALQPVEIVSSLPTTGNFEGRIVYLTTDDKLYRYTGSAWTSAVATADLTGTLGSSLFGSTLRPIEVVGALPSTGNFQGRTVFLTTDNKLYRWTSATTTGTTFWTAVVPAADITGQITTTQITDDAVTTDKIAANAVTAAELAADSVVAGKIAAAAIATANLQANSITADKLVLGDFTNRVQNGDFALGDVSWGTYSGLTFTPGGYPTGYSIVSGSGYLASGFSFLVGAGARATQPVQNANLFPVQAGEVYYFTAVAARVSSPVTDLNIRLTFVDATGAPVAGTNNVLSWTNPADGTSYSQKSVASADVVVPAGAVFAFVEITTSSSLVGESGGSWRVGYVFASKKGDGDLIVDGSITANMMAADSITTDALVAGAVTAAKISVAQLSALTADLGAVTAGTLTSVLVRTSSGTDRVQMDGATNDVRVYIGGTKVAQLGGTIDQALLEIVAASTAWYPALFQNTSTTGGGAGNGGGALYVASHGGWTVEIAGADTGGSGLGTYALNAGNTSSGGGRLLVGASAGSGGWAAYSVAGGYGPFTGVHDGLVAKATAIDAGDIVVNGEVRARKLSDCIAEIDASTAANQPAFGVFVRRYAASPEDPPAAMCLDDGSTDPTWVALCDSYDLAAINGVGEGSVNVCGQGGDIAEGDLIATSDTRGKGMKQADNVVRSHTVAKAREAVTFAAPDEVKQIACIYLSG